ncbi:MAG: cytochrome P460 family protein [Bacteroidetes bacterium]|nr:cytochrome P460 family protein [Bacteroidota bacterium]
MKKTSLIYLSGMAILVLALTQACKKKESTPTPTAVTPTTSTEFIAKDSTFYNFLSWPLQATNHGPDPFLGMAHAGNDSTVMRQVYFYNGQYPANGKYPIGTLIVKHSTNPAHTVNEFTAMVKRGNNFNPTKGDWEFFMLSSNGIIAKDSLGNPMRGANLMGGMCGSCHSQVAYKDYIFSK